MALFLVLAASSFASQFARVAGQVEVPVPEGWRLATDTSSFPIQLVHKSDSAEILVFRSDIGRDDLITDERSLKKSVDLVINEVISTLPHGQLRVSSGFYDQYRAGFVLEFASTDSLSGLPLEHSIKGMIYRLPDDREVMFTVWGKAAASSWPGVREAVKLVQDEFAFRGKYEVDVFGGKRSFAYWPVVLVAAGVLGLLLLLPRKRKAVENRPPSDPL